MLLVYRRECGDLRRWSCDLVFKLSVIMSIFFSYYFYRQGVGNKYKFLWAQEVNVLTWTKGLRGVALEAVQCYLLLY
jgi:hypothetical protein